MRVLVTGASGFVGSALVVRLAREPRAHVRALVRGLAHDLPAGVRECRVSDLSLDGALQRAVDGADAVVHLAARVHVMRDTAVDPLAEFRRVNVDGTMAVARACLSAGVRRFVFLSSIKVHGERGRFSETDAPHPMDAYGISKLEAEEELRTIAASGGMEVVVLRSPLVYGPGVRANFAALARAVARGLPLPFGAVANRRSLIAVDNLLDVIMTSLAHPRAAGETFLVSDGEDLSTPDLIRRLAHAMNRRARLFSVPTPLIERAAALVGRREFVSRLLGSLELDTTKVRERLGWTPPISVDEGIRRAVAGTT